MSTKPYEQEYLDRIKKRQVNELTQCPKAFFELVSFMEGNLRKQFKSFSIFNLCHGSSHKLRFNDAAFEKAFESMMVSERLQFYERAVGYGVEAFGKGRKTKQALDEAINEQVKQLLPQGYKQVQLLIHEGFRSQQHITAKIQKFKLSSRNHFQLNLQNYLLRESKKKSKPQTYILEAINKSHPEHVRFSFVNTDEEKRNYELLRRLAELGFRSTVNSMVLPDVGISPSKLEKRQSVRKSMGRLAEQLRTEEEEFMPVEEVKQSDKEMIRGGNELLEYSKLLAQRKKQARKAYPQQNNNILSDLLSIKSPRSSSVPQSKNKLQQQLKGSQNIFNKVLQSQSQIKLPYNNSNVTNTTQKQTKHDSSPIRGFVSSDVKEYTGVGTRIAAQYKNVFEQMLPEFNLREMDLSVSAKTFKEIYMSTGAMTTILQHNTRPQRYQCRVVLQNLSLQQVYCTLINQQLLKRWNTCVDQSQIKITLTAQNCLICYQKHKRYSTWFKQRDYLFLRHAFTYRQCKYIADKSIEHTSFIPFQSIQRGYVRHMVTRVRDLKERQVEVVVDMSVEHGGFLGVEKRKELNLNYLKQYEHLQGFISKQRGVLSKMPSYCSTEWNIDWIDQSNDGQLPRNLSLKTEDFLQGSQIQQIDFDNAQLQSQDFYSIQDQDQQQSQQTSAHPSTLTDNNNFQFQTTQRFEQQKKTFVKKALQQGQLVEEEKEEIQFEKEKEEEGEESFGEMTTGDPEIVLDDEGYCVLPQKYFGKRHIVAPKDNNVEERRKVFDNIIMKNDFVQNKDGGILLVNKAKIDAQNNVINFIMKTMRKNLLSGKSILSISLPVEIFKADSNTQRLCESMTMGPQFLQKASQTHDPLERMKLSICFALSNSLMYFDIEKPFNPILGETYQGMIDGCPIYAQQVSHHPPITSLYFVGRGFRVHASLEAKVFLHLNSGEGVNYGFYSIVFDDGHVIRFQTGPGELSGFTIGDRKYRFKDKMYVYDKKHCYFSVLNFEDPNAGFFSKSKWQHPDQMQGQILKVTKSFIDKFQQSQQKLTPKTKQIQSSLSKMSGRWIHYLNFDGKLYYNIESEVPYKLVNYEYALNSDAKYREDLIYRVRNDLAKSQIYKENLENRQRRDRKLREQNGGDKH